MSPSIIDEELIPLRQAVARINGADKRYENAMYYRQPERWEVGSPRERENKYAGWIVRAGNNRDRMTDLMERGFVPLRQFGVTLKNPAWTPEAQGTPDQYGEWGAILCHPQGPAAFPVSQVMAFRWYDPKHCPVPGVVFPQLAGMPITEYRCPDCNDKTFGEALHLSRHLRVTHDWTVDDVVKFGEAMGLDFRREFGNSAKTTRTYSPSGEAAPQFAQHAVATPPPVITQVVPVRESAPEPAPEAPKKPRTEKQLANDAKLAASAAARKAAKAA
jgi:hypothetical protein